jgi:hypothetical protein
MAIPESQLSTWSSQGSVTQSATTYETIKKALESPDAPQHSRSFDVFLQGSYGNDTNIFAESDVDIVIQYKGAFFHDLTALPAEQKAAFQSAFSDGTYPYASFKADVITSLQTAFGAAVKPGKKAIKVEANGSRRNADVVVAFDFRRYHSFSGSQNSNYEEGICFFTTEGVRIANYPKQHSVNLTAKHQITGGNFKPIVRIFKNMRVKMVDKGIIRKGSAPSYFIEGLLYNVPDSLFSGSYASMVLNILRWLHQTTDRSKFVCANEQYYLLRDGFPECWPCSDGTEFIAGAVNFWDKWV